MHRVASSTRGVDERAGRTRVETARGTFRSDRSRTARPVRARDPPAARRERRTTRARVDQHRVLAEPAESGAAREVALEQRTGVDVRLARHLRPTVRLDPTVQLRRAARAARRGSRRRARTARRDPPVRVRRSSSRRRSHSSPRDTAVASRDAWRRCATCTTSRRRNRARATRRRPRAVSAGPRRAMPDEVEAEPVRLRFDQRSITVRRTAHARVPHDVVGSRHDDLVAVGGVHPPAQIVAVGQRQEWKPRDTSRARESASRRE